MGGCTSGNAGVCHTMLASSGAMRSATSPGSTITETPRLRIALRMAISSTRGSCSGLETSSQ
ncbi:hypothetical protein D3C72_1628660 [compost metagenome]